MRYVKVTQKLCDNEKERMDKNRYYKNTEWICNKCGWNVSFADDCVVTSVHDYWQKIQDHNQGYSGIYHSWCRILCKVCNQQNEDGKPHPRCLRTLEDKLRKDIRESKDNNIRIVDSMMFDRLTEGNKK